MKKIPDKWVLLAAVLVTGICSWGVICFILDRHDLCIFEGWEGLIFSGVGSFIGIGLIVITLVKMLIGKMKDRE